MKLSDFKFLSKRTVFHDWFDLVQEDVILPNGKKMTFTYGEQRDGVIVLPVTDKGEIVMIEQFRAPAHEISLELVAGICEEGEAPEHAALRELEEETGFKAAKIQHLATICPSVGMMKFKSNIFFATGLTQTKQNLDETEIIDVKLVQLNRFEEIVRKGHTEGGMVLAYHIAKERGLLKRH